MPSMNVGMSSSIAWNCDFCGKSGIVVSKAGMLYCPWCRMSYGEVVNYDDATTRGR